MARAKKDRCRYNTDVSFSIWIECRCIVKPMDVESASLIRSEPGTW
jgi:hypothetical protein